MKLISIRCFALFSIMTALGASGCALQYQGLSLENVGIDLSGVKIQPQYPSAALWNDFVRPSSGVACVASDTDCIHAAERQRVDIVSPIASCAEISVEDSLDAFQWECTAAGNRMRFDGTLRESVSLADLIDATATPPIFRPIGLYFKLHGIRVGSLSPAVLWENAIEGITPVTGSVQNLDTVSRIYVVTASGVTDGLHIGADRVSLVIPEGITLTGTSTNNINWGYMTLASPNDSAMVAIDSRNFTSIEGGAHWVAEDFANTDYTLNCNGQTRRAVVHQSAHYLRLRKLHLHASTQRTFEGYFGNGINVNRVDVSGAGEIGMLIHAGVNTRYTRLNVRQTVNTGIQSVSGTDVQFRDVHFKANLHGLSTGGHTRLVIADTSAIDDTYFGISVSASTNGVFERIRTDNVGYGFYLYNTNTGHRVTNVRVVRSKYAGIIFENSLINNVFNGLYAFDSGRLGTYEGDGIEDDSTTSSANVFTNLVAANNRVNGISLRSGGSVLNGVLSVNNGADGIKVAAAVKSITQATAARNGGHGIHQSFTNAATIYHQVLTLQNAQDGIRLANETSGATLSQIASGHNGGYGIYIGDTGGTPAVKVVNQLILSSNTGGACRLPSGGATGIADGNCTGSAPSQMTLLTPSAMDTSIHGALNVTPATRLPYLSVTAWYSDSVPTRVWAADAGSVGRCVTGQNCQLSDFGLRPSDTVLRNVSGNGLSQNEIFSAGVCPTAVRGDQFAIPYSGTTPYLANAVEDLVRSSGNRNGLCEAGEACLYTPNFGYDQGEGDRGTCTFNDHGGVAGVSMQGYVQNGHAN